MANFNTNHKYWRKIWGPTLNTRQLYLGIFFKIEDESFSALTTNVLPVSSVNGRKPVMISEGPYLNASNHSINMEHLVRGLTCTNVGQLRLKRVFRIFCNYLVIELLCTSLFSGYGISTPFGSRRGLGNSHTLYEPCLYLAPGKTTIRVNGIRSLSLMPW